MIGSVELIAEHLLLAHDLYRAQLAQVILVEVFQVAEDAIGVFAVLDPLFLGGFEVGEGHVLDLFEDGFVAVFRTPRSLLAMYFQSTSSLIVREVRKLVSTASLASLKACLLYTSDAADEL